MLALAGQALPVTGLLESSHFTGGSLGSDIRWFAHNSMPRAAEPAGKPMASPHTAFLGFLLLIFRFFKGRKWIGEYL